MTGGCNVCASMRRVCAGMRHVCVRVRGSAACVCF